MSLLDDLKRDGVKPIRTFDQYHPDNIPAPDQTPEVHQFYQTQKNPANSDAMEALKNNYGGGSAGMGIFGEIGKGAVDTVSKIPADYQKFSQQAEAEKQKPITVSEDVPKDKFSFGSQFAKPEIDRNQWYNPLQYLLSAINEAHKGIKTTGEGIQEIGRDMAGQTNTSKEGVGSGFTKTLGGILQTITSPITGTVEQLPTPLKAGLKTAMNIPMNALSDAVKSIAKDATGGSIDTNSQKFQEQVLQPLNIAAQILMMKHADEAPEAVKGVADVAKKTAEVGVDVAKKVAPRAAGAGLGAFAGGQFGNPLAGAIIGGALGVENIGAILTHLSPDTLRTAFTDTKALSEAQKLGLETVRNMPFEQAKGFIDDAKDQLSESGKAYDPIKQSKTPITLADERGNSWFENFINSKGLKIEKGEIVADKGSSVRSPAEITRLNDLYTKYGKYTKFTRQEFLNFRKDIGKLSDFGEGITSDMQTFARSFYDKLNEKGRPQIQGLEEVDSQFSSLKKAFDNIKNTIYKSNGDVKDNALSSLRTMTKDADRAGTGRGPLADLKSQMPPEEWQNFTQKIKIARALEDLETGKKNWGHYLVNAVVGGFSGGGAGAALGVILGVPEVITNIFKAAGTVAKKTPEFVDSVINKVMNGIKPTGEAKIFVTNAMKKFMDTIATGTALGAAGGMTTEDKKKKPQTLEDIFSSEKASWAPPTEPAYDPNAPLPPGWNH